MAVRFRAVLATPLALASFGLSTPTRVVSLPTGMTVVPRVAPQGSSQVTVSGGGCASDVHVTATAFLFPGTPTSATDQTVTPGQAGTWSAVFSMPSAPAYVIATCDGVTSAPVVVAPSDVFTGSMSYSALTPTEIEITTSPLQDGSDFTIFDTSGNVLGTAVESFGTATVRLSRSLGPAQVIAVGLRQRDRDIDLPYVPFARQVQLPLPSQPSIVVEPRVTAMDNTVMASGNCSGLPHLIVTGQAAGWHDIPPVYLDVVLLADASGNWMTLLPMPPIPSTATVRCTQGAVTESAVILISPSSGLLMLSGERDGSGVLVTIPNVISPERLVAFTAGGAPVPIAIEAIVSNGVQARLEPQGVPVRIVIVGIETLGENATARQNSRVQGWAIDVGSIVDVDARACPSTFVAIGSGVLPQPAVRLPMP